MVLRKGRLPLIAVAIVTALSCVVLWRTARSECWIGKPLGCLYDRTERLVGKAEIWERNGLVPIIERAIGNEEFVYSQCAKACQDAKNCSHFTVDMNEVSKARQQGRRGWGERRLNGGLRPIRARFG